MRTRSSDIVCGTSRSASSRTNARNGSAPALWVLDEPFTALDAAASQWLSTLIARHLERGGTCVLTSHQPVAIGSAAAEAVIEL